MLNDRTMQRLIAIYSAIVLLGIGNAYASMATIINQQYHVSGNYHLGSSEGPNDVYDMLNDAPVNISIYNQGIYASSIADLFIVSASSNGYSRDFAGNRIMGTSQAISSGYWTFTPPSDCHQFILQIDVEHAYYYDLLEVQLQDITSGEQMYSFTGKTVNIPHWYDTEPFLETFSVNSEHQYYMSAYIQSTAGGDGAWSGSIALITPEPATLLLLTLGSLILRKRKA